MNDPRGPRRFSKYQDGVSVKDFLLALTGEKFIGIDRRFSDLKDAISEAKRIMEDRMRGFPSEFAQKGDMVTTAATLKELKDKDLKELKGMFDNTIGRLEYENKHLSIIEKIDALNRDINDLKNERANIQGRIVATGATVGIIISILLIATQFIVHLYFGKG